VSIGRERKGERQGEVILIMGDFTTEENVLLRKLGEEEEERDGKGDEVGTIGLK